jgi:hypothetical protein
MTSTTTIVANVSHDSSVLPFSVLDFNDVLKYFIPDQRCPNIVRDLATGEHTVDGEHKCVDKSSIRHLSIVERAMLQWIARLKITVDVPNSNPGGDGEECSRCNLPPYYLFSQQTLETTSDGLVMSLNDIPVPNSGEFLYRIEYTFHVRSKSSSVTTGDVEIRRGATELIQTFETSETDARFRCHSGFFFLKFSSSSNQSIRIYTTLPVNLDIKYAALDCRFIKKVDIA